MLQRLINWLLAIQNRLDAAAVAREMRRAAGKDQPGAFERLKLRLQAWDERRETRRRLIAAIDAGEPLIYTSRGMLPISELQYFIEWTERPEEIVFREVYTLQDGVTIVKDSRAVKQRVGMQLGAVAEPIA